MTYFDDPARAVDFAMLTLDRWGQPLNPGHWQGVKTTGKPDMVTKELIDLQLEIVIPETIEEAAEKIKPNLPWADRHFQERVSGEPTNPGEEYKNWPWWRDQDAHTLTAGRGPTNPLFTHTYQERFWPKQADIFGEPPRGPNAMGIRYEYGDLNDVLELLYQEPYTRQATFPIFFPEDTGAVHRGRIPCTLHYHFLMRNNKLHLFYPIRSCDAVRHFRDDIYMAMLLDHWVIERLIDKELWANNDEHQLWNRVKPGKLYFTAYSFHVHMGDYHHLQREVQGASSRD